MMITDENLIFDTRVDTHKLYVSMNTKIVPRKYPGKKIVPLYLHITGLGKRERLHLDVDVNINDWCDTTSRVKFDKLTYKLNSDTNLIIENIEAKITNIKTVYRLSEQVLTPAKLKKELIEDLPRVNFCSFFENALKDERPKLKHSTYKKTKGILSKLKKYDDMILFSDMNLNWFERYRTYLHKIGNKKTTVNTNIKVIKKFIRIALKAGIKIPCNLDDIKIGSTAGSRVALDATEVIRMQKYYYADFVNERHQLVLGYFLFSCFTGLRFADVMKLTRENVQQDYIQFTAEKVNKTQTITLNNSVKKIIAHNKNLFVQKLSNEHINRELKTISKSLGICKTVTFHVSRHTFATSFLRAGGKIEKLQQLLGHSDLRMVMVYVHIVAAEANEEIFLLDKLF